MATTLIPNPSSSSSSVLGIPSKLHRFLFVSLSLVVVFLAIAGSSSARASDMAPNNLQYSHKTLLFSDPSAEKNGAETVDFQPRKMGSHRHQQQHVPYYYKSKEKSEYEASKHEVPSGPNPIQN